MLTIHPTSQQLDQLRELRYRHPVAAVQRRAEIVLLVGWGRIATRTEIAAFAGVHLNTVTNTLRRFIDAGVEGLLQADPDVPDPELDAFHHLLREEWSQHPPATLKQAARQLEEATGISRGPSAVRRLLLRLGFRRRKAGSVPAKADPEEQARYVHYHMRRHLNAAERGEEAVFFLDSSHFVFGAFLGYLWCLARTFVRTSAGRMRYNVLGAVDISRGKLLTVTNNTYITAESVCQMLGKMAKSAAGLPVTVFLDNARYQRCALVMAKAKALDITLKFLPTYSPNLNLIERLWKHVKKTCLTNRHHEDFTAFQQAIDQCLKESFTKNKEEMASLLTLNFQIIANSQIMAA
jgi:transposase